MKFRRQRRDELDINLTPLIDVVFLLLIFFMVSTTFNKETHLNLSLPKVDHAVDNVDMKTIDVVISAKGQYSVNGKALANNQEKTLRQALLDAAGDDKNLPFVITADANSSHQSVVTVMDVAGDLGFTRMQIATQREQ